MQQRISKLVLKLMFLAVTLAIFGIFAACRGGAAAERDVFERIQNALLSMTSYQADATVTYISNRSQHTYHVRQMARSSGEYRIEVTGPERVAGNITINDNRNIVQFNTRAEGHYAVLNQESPERLELFVTSFIRNYLQSQEVTVSVASIDNSLVTVLEANIPGEHPYMRTSRLSVSNESLKPVRLEIFDADGALRVSVEFSNFEYNVNFDDRLFRVQ
ncbi:MAG: hypothetical protein FWC95_00970 [Defluviitaleaceae bacterium]|nr:hypothetical protein [Defluviitaleaceae bacterium]